MSNETSETLKAHRAKLEAKLKELEAEIAKWQARAEGAGADARLKTEEVLARLREGRKTAQARLADLQTTSEDAWSAVRSGAEQAWKDLHQALDDARKHLQDKP